MKTDNTALEEPEISEEITCSSGNIQRETSRTTYKLLGDAYFARPFLRKGIDCLACGYISFKTDIALVGFCQGTAMHIKINS